MIKGQLSYKFVTMNSSLGLLVSLNALGGGATAPLGYPRPWLDMMGGSWGSKELPGEGGVRKAERTYIGSSGWEKVFFFKKKMSRGEQVSIGAADNEMLSYSNWSWREGSWL